MDSASTSDKPDGVKLGSHPWDYFCTLYSILDHPRLPPEFSMDAKSQAEHDKAS